MSSVVHPVGDKPPRVYWTRRILVLLLAGAAVVALGFVVMLVVRYVGGLGGDSPTAAGSPSPSVTSTADGPTACGPADLQVVLVADAAGYPAGANPSLTLTVVNSGSRSCTFDSSAANREIVITSGADRIWSSKDCQAETPEDLLLLGAGAGSPATVSWDRSRSAAGCPAGLAAPRPGTYKATATVAGITVPSVVFTLG